MAHGDAQEGKWRGNWRMEWVASTLHTTSEHGVSSITTANAHTSAASSRLNWCPRQFKWTRPFCWKTKSGFCVCAITFQTQSTVNADEMSKQSIKLQSSCSLWLPQKWELSCTRSRNLCWNVQQEHQVAGNASMASYSSAGFSNATDKDASWLIMYITQLNTTQRPSTSAKLQITTR
jgi:hypothetical protein